MFTVILLLAIFVCRDLFDDLFVKVHGKSVKENKDVFCVDLLEELRSINLPITIPLYHVYMRTHTFFFTLCLHLTISFFPIA